MTGRPSADDIAVVGMAGRFPGARDVEEFWGNLRAGVESVSFFSVEELVAAGVPREVAESPSYVGAGSEVEGVDEFDADFFGYTAFEAQLMDPQHRLFLESAWSALESAGYDSDRFGGRIGVFGGAGSNGYLQNVYSDPAVLERSGLTQILVANEINFLSTRVSYKLDLRGPSVSLRTACSTSLVALHLACQSLRSGECEMALSGGSHVFIGQDTGYHYEDGSFVSPDGHCRPFDVGAAGTVFGSGVGVVVLRRLEDALAAGDSVLAVVKGSAVNNDGAVKASFTAPSVGGQAAVVAEALASAGVDASSIGYVEAHGTGTLLGDPIEVRALTQAFRGSGSSGGVGFCGLGSLKSNVGHLDAAAGIAGLVKAIQALRYEELPPTVNFSAPNPEIDFGSSPFRVVERLEAWPRSGVPRRAGVSAFGFGGTNAHVIVEEAPVGEVPVAGPRDGEVLVLSARSEAALEEMSDQLAAALDAADGSGDKGGFLGDVSFTLAVGRREFPFRRVVVAPDPRAAAVAIRERDPGRVLSHYLVAPASGVAFLFSGQGAQYSGMAAGLYRHEPVFAAAVDECAGVLNPVLDVDLRDLIFAAFQEGSGGGARGELSQTQLAQPALFTVEYALAVLLRSWGIIPEAMLGHSLGEYVAACLAGVFDLRSALGLVALRGRLMQAQCPGSMLSIAASLDETRSLLADFTGQSDDSGGRDLVALAAHNGPRDCVVSGPSEAVGALEEHAAQLGFTTAGLDTSHAFHSPLMEPMVEEFRAAVAKVELHSPAVPFVSNVTGTWITGQQATDPGYWAGHIRSTVQFAAGLATLTSGNDHTLLEIGPGQTLASLARRAIKTPVSRSGSDGGQPAPARLITHTLPHRKDPRTATHTLQRTLGQLWTHGHTPDWTSYWTGQTRHRIPLPTYPFQRRRHWLNQATPIPTTHETTRRISDWFYLPSWRRTVPPRVDTDRVADEDWLVLMDSAGLGRELETRLRSAGARVRTVHRGDRFARTGEESFTLVSNRRQDYDSLLSALDETGFSPSRIVHLWMYDGTGDQVHTEQVVDDGFISLTHLAGAIGSAGLAAPSDTQRCLKVVGNSVQSVTGIERLTPAKSLVLGPIRVLPTEFPGWTASLIDLETGGETALPLASILMQESCLSSAATVVAYRGIHRWEQHFQPQQLEPPVDSPFRTGGVYLITGGLGALGLKVARRLAESKARITLIGRTEIPPRDRWDELLRSPEQGRLQSIIADLRELEGCGAEILVVPADVAEPEQLHAAVRATVERWSRVDGVFHTAGVAGGGLLQSGDRAIAPEVLRPKLQGTEVLFEALGDLEPSFVVLFGSNAANVGNIGQSGYCAANAHLAAFAHAQAGRGRVTCIDWTAWRDAGMAVEARALSGLRDLRPEDIQDRGISSRDGIDALERILSAGPLPEVVVSPIDLEELFASVLSIDDLDQDARADPGDPSSARVVPAPPARNPRPEIMTGFVAPRTPTEQQIAQVWEDVFGFERVGVDDNFFDLGGNSLIAIQMVTVLNRELETRISVAQLYDALTIGQIATALHDGADKGARGTDDKTAIKQDQAERLRKRREHNRRRRSARSGGSDHD